MVLEGFMKDQEGVLTARVNDEVTIDVNEEGDRVWINQEGGNYSDCVYLDLTDAKKLIRLLQTWMDTVNQGG